MPQNSIHYFNTGHETAVLNGSPYYQPPASVAQMRHELSFLPAWYAQNGDLILVPNDFDFDFYEKLKFHLPGLPQPLSIDNQINMQNKICKNTPTALWGCSPEGLHFFEKLKKENKLDLQIPQWNEKIRLLTSRQTARECLLFLKNKFAFVEMDIPVFVHSMQEAENVIYNARKPLIAKSPFSSSGRGLLRINPYDFNRATRQILHGMLQKQGSVSIEKALKVETDFAMEFLANGAGKVDFVGYSLFSTNHKGAYQSNIVASQSHIIQEIIKKIPQEKILEIKQTLTAFLSEQFCNYSGCIGVDMLLYSENCATKIYPCVEINVRTNMGILALNFAENYLYEGKTGRLYVDFCKNTGDIFRKFNRMNEKFQPVFKDNRLLSGFLPLCPVKEKSQYGAYVLAAI